MKSLAVEALLVLVVALCSVGLGYQVGKKNTNTAWEAKEGKRLQAEAGARDAEVRRGDKASGAFQAELLAQRIENDHLTKAFNAYKRRSHPILVRTAGAAAPRAAAGDSTSCAAPASAREDAAPALSLGAVWMWNSALVGRDAPAGACGLADTSEGTCAADSGIRLDEAWDNQAVNARICAEDRLRHQRLIDYINGRGTAAPHQQ